MMVNPQVRSNIEQFLVRHVLPEFSNQAGYMRAIVSFELTALLLFVNET